jgi:AraC-like DNA-binding protein
LNLPVPCRQEGSICVPFFVDHLFREQMNHISPAFPITYFHDEIADLPDRAGPVHWHPELEIVTARTGVLDYQVGGEHIFLREGDSIFVNSNMLHGIRQISGETADPMPGIVFLGTLIAPQNSLVYQKYIHRILICGDLPYLVFRKGGHEQFHNAVRHIYELLEKCPPLYEMEVLKELALVFIYLNEHFDEFPRCRLSRVQISAQIRVQQMLSYIYEHYDQDITLADISAAASISRSEAGRCFSAYLGSSPVSYLIRYRLQRAYSLLSESSMTIHEISQACGFRSAGYFSRQFRMFYGCSPGSVASMGK